MKEYGRADKNIIKMKLKILIKPVPEQEGIIIAPNPSLVINGILNLKSEEV